MSKLDQMCQRQAGRDLVINGDVGHAGHSPVSGNGNCGQRRFFLNRGIHGDEAFDTARH